MTIAVKDNAVSAIFQPDNSGAVKDRMLIIGTRVYYAWCNAYVNFEFRFDSIRISCFILGADKVPRFADY